MRIFIGMDRRQAVAYTVLQNSIIRRASRLDYSIAPLCFPQIEKICDRRGLTDFSYSRFLVPYLCDYQGHALFIDADMLMRCDVLELQRFFQDNKEKAVSVVMHTGERAFERPSLMLFNNERCDRLTPEFIKNDNPYDLNKWSGHRVGEIPKEYNHLVGYDAPNSKAKIAHFTMGIPIFSETENCEFADEWKREFEIATHSCPWEEIMGNSVHKAKLNA